MSTSPFTQLAPRIGLTWLAIAAACVSSASGNNAQAATLAASHETFLENGGQWDGHARYLMQGKGVNLWLTQDGPRYQFIESKPMAKKAGEKIERHRSFALQLSFIGGRALNLNALRPIPGVANFIDSSSKAKHQTTGLHRYEAVEATDVYPGINARFTSARGVPRYDLIVKPGADPTKINIRFDGVSSMHRRADGAIEISTPLGTLQHKDLLAYQGIGTSQRQVACTMSCEGNTLRFHPGKYDHSKPLVIDPVFVGTYFGTGNESLAKFGGIPGRVVLAGTTSSLSFPVSLGLDGQGTITGNTVGFISVLASNLRSIIYSTYIGNGSTGVVGNASNETDEIQDAVMDAKGRLDFTLHTNFHNVSQNVDEDDLDFWQLDGSGALTFYNYIVRRPDINSGNLIVAVSPSGNTVAIAGTDRPGNGSDTWFVQRFDGSLGFAQAATNLFLNAVHPTEGGVIGLAVDDQGDTVVSGETYDGSYPVTAGAYQAAANNISTGFVTLLSPNLAIRASTFLSGSTDGFNAVGAVAFDRTGGIAATGWTSSTTFPVSTGAVQGTLKGVSTLRHVYDQAHP